ncbi:MAG: 3-hydroxyacyl-CoA dehydrogenase NAD-binding domain-containing protein [bacterium]
MSHFSHWSLSHDEQEIAWLTLDVAHRGVNTLSHQVIQELKQQLEEIAAEPPRGLVIQSGKSAGFIAGADVNEFTRIKDEAQALSVIEFGQSAMDQIEQLPFPTLALIKGHCLGGGLELALACDYRILVNTPSTRLAFPEIKLGIHPGFGGTVRSLRLMGTRHAMDLMLSGRSISAYQAKKMGLADACVPERQAANAIRHFVQARPSSPAPALLDQMIAYPWVRPAIAHFLMRQTKKKAPPKHYPAPYALIDFWQRHAGSGDSMYKEEARSVARLITHSTSRNLVRVFELRNAITTTGDKKKISPHHVHVIGAGTMGGDIASWCALQGMTVTIEDAFPEALGRARQRALKFFAKRLRGFDDQLIAATDRFVPDPKGLGRSRADVVIEAIYENLEAKQNLFKELETQAQPHTLLTSNTSSIPIEDIAGVLTAPARLVGLHFFNPVAKMPLIEVVHAPDTDREQVAAAAGFCRHINKLPLPVKSSPGFLVNRILMPYLLEAALMVDEGMAIEDIDNAALDFGMPMGPLELADTVGLDICHHVADTLSTLFQASLPRSLQSRVKEENLGRKTGKGFYDWKNNHKQATASPRLESSRREKIQRRLIGKITSEAKRCLEEGLVENGDQVDAGVIFGTGFAPWTGGPLHYLKSET